MFSLEYYSQGTNNIEIPRHVADTTKMESLGWRPAVSMEDGLQNTIESFRSVAQ